MPEHARREFEEHLRRLLQGFRPLIDDFNAKVVKMLGDLIFDVESCRKRALEIWLDPGAGGLVNAARDKRLELARRQGKAGLLIPKEAASSARDVDVIQARINQLEHDVGIEQEAMRRVKYFRFEHAGLPAWDTHEDELERLLLETRSQVEIFRRHTARWVECELSQRSSGGVDYQLGLIPETLEESLQAQVRRRLQLIEWLCARAGHVYAIVLNGKVAPLLSRMITGIPGRDSWWEILCPNPSPGIVLDDLAQALHMTQGDEPGKLEYHDTARNYRLQARDNLTEWIARRRDVFARMEDVTVRLLPVIKRLRFFYIGGIPGFRVSEAQAASMVDVARLMTDNFPIARTQKHIIHGTIATKEAQEFRDTVNLIRFHAEVPQPVIFLTGPHPPLRSDNELLNLGYLRATWFRPAPKPAIDVESTDEEKEGAPSSPPPEEAGPQRRDVPANRGGSRGRANVRGRGQGRAPGAR
jgi:hypothetical protein